MPNKLFYNTVSPLLLQTLNLLMKTKEFEMFRLVGGTALSLYRGHRQSVDIDLFTDAEYSSIDFSSIDSFLKENYPYVDSNKTNIIGMGKSFYIGENKNNCIKLDVYYTDKFIHPINLIDNIRLASIEEIIAMKIDVVSRIGRKKDFWDIHDLSHN
jgi:predicted nucleotidyltransferase component of viral defense system